jgi:hypothetical protein
MNAFFASADYINAAGKNTYFFRTGFRATRIEYTVPIFTGIPREC